METEARPQAPTSQILTRCFSLPERTRSTGCVRADSEIAYRPARPAAAATRPRIRGHCRFRKEVRLGLRASGLRGRDLKLASAFSLRISGDPRTALPQCYQIGRAS